MKGGIDLSLHTEAIENRLGTGVVLDGFFGAFRNLPDQRLHPLRGLGIVHDHGVHFVSENITHRPVDQIGFFK